MKNNRFARMPLRSAAVVSTLALAAAALAGLGASGTTTAAPAKAPAGASAVDPSYINYVAPRAERSVAYSGAWWTSGPILRSAAA